MEEDPVNIELYLLVKNQDVCAPNYRLSQITTTIHRNKGTCSVAHVLRCNKETQVDILISKNQALQISLGTLVGIDMKINGY